MKTVKDLPLPARILRAAFITFGERGFDKASMDEVADVAGTTKRTVYAHFTNKETLFRASIGQATEWFLAELPVLDPAGDPEAELTRFASRFSDLSTWIGPVRLQRVVIAEAERLSDLAETLHRQVIGGAEERIAAFLTARGLINPATQADGSELRAPQAARLFLNMTTGPRRFATLMEALRPETQHPNVTGFGNDDDWVRFAVRFFLHGLTEPRSFPD
ncbi:TetR/AcrR family transcriptional regulator [Methylobrevis pamukkalensis]|uniref:DNA-binding transcriptional repressor AcrR n=1 Tax=Methylobrevis pamukkalensis TaxID=1439726 RepID=A0A1E3GYW7_9HYPH|nr:TetR/AcrR family transcriptional regulator [Methylobrevis pamukkalensis]ODN68521.1 DNA-binding transcriptional repressor AcrR [Methylobrevis pamukkalensis]